MAIFPSFDKLPEGLGLYVVPSYGWYHGCEYYKLLELLEF